MPPHRSVRRVPCGRAAVAVLFALAVSACVSSDGDGEGATDAEATTTTFQAGPFPPEVTGIDVRTDLPADTAEELEQAVVEVMNEAGIPGAYVGVDIPEVGAWEAVAGTADLETGEPVEFGFTWPIRSLTKSFVVTRLLQLVDQGLVSLDDPVDNYVEGVPNGDQITLRQLAGMSSGLPNYTATDAFLDTFIDDPEQPFTIAQLNELAFTAETEFPPGDEHKYSNTNTNLIGQVIEVVADEPLGDQLAVHIAAPLGLDDTAYLPEALPEPSAVGYQPGESGYSAPPNNFSAMGPSGAMISTADDLKVWVEALVTGELLSAETHAARLEAAPLVEGPVYDTYGLGIGSRDGYWGHTGQGLGFTALALRHPDTGATVVVLANASETDPQPMDGLFAAVAPIIDGL